MMRMRIIAPSITAKKAKKENHLLSDPAEALKKPATFAEQKKANVMAMKKEKKEKTDIINPVVHPL
jgi:hypothetical protein